MTTRPVGCHWIVGAVAEAVELGATFTWMPGSTIHQPAHAAHWADVAASPLDILLEIPLNQDLLFDRGGCFGRDMRSLYQQLGDRGLLSRVLAVQWEDEIQSRMAHRGQIMSAAAWPALVHIPPDERPPFLNVLLADRTAELRAIWGDDWPARGMGVAEPGQLADIAFSGLSWIGLNAYPNPGYYQTPEGIRAAYDAVARSPYGLMAVLGVFADGVWPAPSLETLAAAYGPVLAAHRDRCWALAVFLLHHPSAAGLPGHGMGRGLLELDPIYREAVRTVIRDWRAAA